MKKSQNSKEKVNKVAKLGKIFIFAGVICTIIGLMYWRASHEEQRLAEQQGERTVKLDGEQSHEMDPTPPTPVPAITDSWYRGEQMIPSKELGENADWQIAVYGDVLEQGLDDSMVRSRNLTDSELAKSLSVLFLVEDDDGQRKSFEDYAKTPVTIEPGKSYQIEFDCTWYNLFLPVDQETMKYFIAPIRLEKGDETAITFALYDKEERQFHQICVPFRTENSVEIKYALDDVFAEETWGQVYRLCFEVTEADTQPDPNPGPGIVPDASSEGDESSKPKR